MINKSLTKKRATFCFSLRLYYKEKWQMAESKKVNNETSYNILVSSFFIDSLSQP